MKDWPALGKLVGKRRGLFLALLCICVGVGALYFIHPDVGLGAAVIAIYGWLYWLYRRTQPFRQNERYGIVHYRGRSGEKRKFFS